MRHGTRTWFLAAGVLLLPAGGVRADTGGGGGGPVQLGDCERGEDPPSVIFCLRGKAGAEITTVSGAPKENVWVRHGSVYGGIFAGEGVSLQARGYARDLLPLDEGTGDLDRSVDFAVLQIGNPALHHVWMDIGRMRLPFGLDLSGASELYRSLETRAFWASPPHGAAISLDDQKALRLDLGYGTDELVNDEGVPSVHAVSGRLMYDISALEGSRLVLSGYGENHGIRRYGFGFVTVNRKGDTTQFEFVRLRRTPDGKASPFEQLLRAGYVGTWRNETRWVVQFDDERFRARMGTLGHDLRLWGHVIFRVSVAHYKSEAGDKHRRWLVTSGVEAEL